MLPKLTGVYASAMILAAATQAAGEYPGFAWMTNSDGGKAYLVYGSPETGEDYLFESRLRPEEEVQRHDRLC